MKKTKLALTALLAVVAMSVQAQKTVSKSAGGTTFGVRAGVNFQNLNGKSVSGADLDYKLKTGFNIGVNAEIPVADEFYVQPGLLFSTKGAKAKGSDAKINLSYLELPIHFLYKPALGDGKLLLGIGPYFAYALGGKIKDGSDVDIKFKSSVTYAEYQTAPYMKRFDAGGDLLFGYEMSNNFSVQFNAQLGMVKINSKVDNFPGGDKGKAKNTGFGVSVGYRF